MESQNKSNTYCVTNIHLSSSYKCRHTSVVRFLHRGFSQTGWMWDDLAALSNYFGTGNNRNDSLRWPDGKANLKLAVRILRSLPPPAPRF